MGFIGSSSVAGAGRPRRGGGSAYGISAVGNSTTGCGAVTGRSI